MVKNNEELTQKLEQEETKARAEAKENRKAFRESNKKANETLFAKEDQKAIGEGNWTRFGFDLNPQVTFSSLAILFLFIALTLLFPEGAHNFFDYLLEVITNYTGWFLILTANVFVFAAAYFAFSRYGSVVIGGKDAKPEFTRWAWYAMLLAAGMGIGLLFWSVAEPVLHLGEPSPMFHSVEPNTPQAARAAMATTFFHWGLHPWAIYAIVGLGVAFFSYNKGLPLTIRSLFYPLIGNKIYGLMGYLIDILAVLATLTGLATSLGFGVAQVNAGLNHLFGLSISTTTQVLLIIGITGIATISVILGLSGGVKRLSEINMALAGVFLVFILIAGPTVYILSGFTENIGFYIANFMEMSFFTEAFNNSNWQGLWTIFYWSWWISWSPFVGMFIARISRGRSVREFIFGVVFVPTIISFFFMSVFGGAAIYQQLTGISNITSIVSVDESLALFSLVENLPISSVLSTIGIILVTIFFVTSADSGALVVDYLTSGGKLDAPARQRIFWAVMSGGIAATLLVGGGLTAFQTASIVTGLPFAVVLLLMIYSLYLGLRQEFLIEKDVDEKLDEIKKEHEFEEKLATKVENKALVEDKNS